MTFIHDNQAIVAGIIHIYRLGHRHDICFQVVATAILVPHIPKIGRTDNERTAGKGHLINLGYGTGSNGLTQSHHIANHSTTSLVAVQMAGSNLDGCLLEVEEVVLELWRQRELLDAATRIGTQMVGCLQIDIIRWNDVLASPTVVDGVNEFLGDVDTEAVVPAVIKPGREFLRTIAIAKLGIQFALFGESGVGQVAAAHDGLNGIEVIVRTIGQIEFGMQRFCHIELDADFVFF